MKTEGIEAATHCDPKTGFLYRIHELGNGKRAIYWWNAFINLWVVPGHLAHTQRLVAIDHVQRAEPEPPKGATHRDPNGGFLQRTATGTWLAFDPERACWLMAGIVESGTLTELPKDDPAVWDGTGLPPVLTVCLTNHEGEELTVKILAYGDHHEDKCVLVADMSHGFEGKMYGWLAAQCVFRPIRTPEQIAADARLEAAKALQKAMWPDRVWGGIPERVKPAYLRAIDAGYHK